MIQKEAQVPFSSNRADALKYTLKENKMNLYGNKNHFWRMLEIKELTETEICKNDKKVVRSITIEITTVLWYLTVTITTNFNISN